jgi:DNA-binding response OmpR family regulator
VSMRVLLVEDEAFISLLIQEAVTNLGCDIVGPTTTIAASIAILGVEQIDVALVDLALNGELCLPVADVLVDKGIPFSFVTGFGSEMLRGTRHAEVAILSKPFSLAALTNLVRKLAADAAAPVSERPAS